MQPSHLFSETNPVLNRSYYIQNPHKLFLVCMTKSQEMSIFFGRFYTHSCVFLLDIYVSRNIKVNYKMKYVMYLQRQREWWIESVIYIPILEVLCFNVCAIHAPPPAFPFTSIYLCTYIHIVLVSFLLSFFFHFIHFRIHCVFSSRLPFSI